MRGDQIEVYKMMNNMYDDEVEQVVKRKEQIRETRGHNLKLQSQKYKTDMLKFNFKNRVVNTWNSLPAVVVHAPTLNNFKNRLDKYWAELDSDMIYDYEQTYKYERETKPTNIIKIGACILQQEEPDNHTNNNRN